MSFWSDSSSVVKIAVVVGVIGVAVCGYLWLGGGHGEDTGGQRGLQAE